MQWWVWTGSIEEGLLYGIMALGVYITFRVLAFPDLTVDGTFPLGAAVAAVLITNGTSPVLATLIAFVAGCAGGLLTGLLHTKLKITGLLAGILSMSALYSLNLRIMGRSNIPLLWQPTIFRQLEDLGIPYDFVELITLAVLAIVVKLALDFFLTTEVGHALRATGDNPQMVQSFGVDTDWTKTMGLMIANGLVAFAGALLAQSQGYADAGMGIGIIIAGLASVIIGEVVIRPATVFTATLAVIVGSVLYRLAILIALRGGFAATDLKIVTAVIVVVALSMPTLKEMLMTRAQRNRMHKQRTVR